jgi:hypothetical protein
MQSIFDRRISTEGQNLGRPEEPPENRGNIFFHWRQLSLELATEIVLVFGRAVGMNWLSLDSF